MYFHPFHTLQKSKSVYNVVREAREERDGMAGLENPVEELIVENKQMSEAFCNSLFLALSGGFQDAYTYNSRGKVFSNAQTGNVVLMSQHFMEGALAGRNTLSAAAVGICGGSVYCREDTVSASICKTSALETGHFVSRDCHFVYCRFYA